MGILKPAICILFCFLCGSAVELQAQDVVTKDSGFVSKREDGRVLQLSPRRGFIDAVPVNKKVDETVVPAKEYTCPEVSQEKQLVDENANIAVLLLKGYLLSKDCLLFTPVLFRVMADDSCCNGVYVNGMLVNNAENGNIDLDKILKNKNTAGE